MRHAELQKTGQHGKRKRPIDLEIDDSSVEEETSPVVRDLNEEELATYDVHCSQYENDQAHIQLQKLQRQFMDEAVLIKEPKISAVEAAVAAYKFQQKLESTVNSSRCLSEEVKQHLLQNAPQIAAQHLKMKKERTQLKAQQQALEQQAQQTSKVFPQPEEVDEPMDRNRRNAANIRRRLKSKFLRQREETINKEVIDEFLGK